MACRSVWLDQGGKIGRRCTINRAKCKGGKFVSDALFDRQPMKRLKIGGIARRMAEIKYDPSQSVLDALELI